jgi:Spermidine synthase
MLFLAVLSGLINLSSQTVFQKVVSMTMGDLYTTFMTVTLTFILGSAIGSYYGHKFRRYLPWIELITGCYSLLIFILLQGPFYKLNLPLALVVIGLMLPALALGTHVPLYSYYLRRVRFGLIYCLYHFGAIFGLIAFEWYYVHAGSVKLSVLIVGLLQVSLGALLLYFKKKGRFALEAEKKVFDIFELVKSFPRSAFTVLGASTLSLYMTTWALKTQIMVTEGLRLQATLISCAVFTWMALGGVLAKKVRVSSELLFFSLALIAFCIFQFFADYSLWITDQFSGELPNYFAFSFLHALILTIPVFISSLIFVNETSHASSKFDVDTASGGLNLIASFGNILGFIIGGLLAAHFWDQLYFAILIAGAAIMVVTTSLGQKGFLVKTVAIIIVAMLSIFNLKNDFKNGMFQNRITFEARKHYKISDVEIHSHVLSSIAFFTSTSHLENDPPARIYVVDGHYSHDFWSGMEFISGLASAKLSTKHHNRSLVVGIGSGQAAWAVNAISLQTDMVEISPVVLKNLELLKKDNFDLLNNPRAKIYLEDAFNFLRNCEPGTYDLILNTATYPSNFNASKLYSNEFVEMAHRCMTPDGIFQTYFDASTVQSQKDFDEFMAPIMKYFKYVDIMIEPYPQVLASNVKKTVKPFVNTDFVEASEFEEFYKVHSKHFDLQCRPFHLGVAAPPADTLLNTLDRPYLERNSIRDAVKKLSPHYIYKDYLEFYRAPDGSKANLPCE